MPERVVTIDVVRGLLMLYIVLVIHGLFWLDPIPHSVSSLLLFEMPAIFWVSGYAYFLAEERRRAVPPAARGYFAFIEARLSRILVPYLVYALACVALSVGESAWTDEVPPPPGEIALTWLNPFSYGGEHSFGMLNRHLWFIPVFLLVTALLPLLSRIRLPFEPPLWAFVACAGLVLLGLAQLEFAGAYYLKQVLFYSLWAVLGFHMARPQVSYSVADFAKAALTSAAGLAAVLVVHADMHALNMQRNKFPPNHTFLLFTSLWMAGLLGLAKLLRSHAGRFNALGRQFWLKPFVSAGYSIYLWHGLGYTAGSLLGKAAELPLFVTWLCALVCSVMFGLLAAPVERLRFRDWVRA